MNISAFVGFIVLSRPWRSAQGRFDVEFWVLELSFLSRLIQGCRLTIGCLRGVKGSRALALRSFLLRDFRWSSDTCLVYCGRNIVLVLSAGRGVLRPVFFTEAHQALGVLWRAKFSLVWWYFKFFVSATSLGYVGACLVERLCVVELMRKERSMVRGQQPPVFKRIQFI